MVIPWVGFPRADVIKRLGPTSRAKYVEVPPRCWRLSRCGAEDRAAGLAV